jgi:heat shock protein HslJ
MRTFSWIFVGLLVGACAAADVIETPADPESVGGRRFASVSVTQAGVDVPLVHLNPQAEARLTVGFYGLGISASGGCNSTSLDLWTIDNGILLVGGEADSTIIGCGPQADAQDRWWVAFLRSGPAIQWDTSNRLVITSDEIVVTLVEDPLQVPPRGRPPG